YAATSSGLRPGEVDVGTANAIIEVKQPGADPGDTPAQIHNLVANFPGKRVILYAPGYKATVTRNALNAGASAVVDSCQALHAALS
ncbi:MAG TPA: hypothetical protein VFV38_16450, partial [Ktedonobacteraceae bacterium]|nr:hypothetical protein [Ktedonobacteraceae bacterium]